MSSSNKFARGAARIQFRHSQNQNRGSIPLRPCAGPSSTKRIPLRQPKDGSAHPNNGGSATSQEESFQLLPCPVTAGRPFAMIIRLQPEMLEELKQADSEGHESMIKFGAYATGHEIRVGSETFSFSSAPEPGDLCDIYEQKVQENEENVLIEAGSAWRKLSVQRILSATEKDRVKQRTAEAEKRQRQRKSILVDQSTQRVISSTSVSEGNRKLPPKISKEPPPKKHKVASPIPFQSDTYLMKPRSLPEKIPMSEKITTPEKIPVLEKLSSEEKLPVSEKIIGSVKEDSPCKDKVQNFAVTAGAEIVKNGSATNMTDLRNFIISFLQENPKGVTIKAVGKAVGEGLSGSQDRKVIEKVINSIATYQAPGRYLLNPGVEKGNVDTLSGRAQETARYVTHEETSSIPISQRESVDNEKELLSLPEREQPDSVTQDLGYVSHKEASDDEFIQLLEDDEKTDQENSQSHMAVQKPNDAVHEPNDVNIDGSGSSSSSGSASESESDSSASGSSDSGSVSGSASGSDSSSSSESMDEEVDIMSDDDVANKIDMKQKVKRDAKGISNESRPLMPGEKTEEKEFESNVPELMAISGEGNGESVAESPRTLMDTLFGMDEESAPGENFTVNKVADKNLKSPQNIKEQMEKMDLDGDARGRPSVVDEEVDMDTSVVPKDRTFGNKLVFNVSQPERQKFTLTHRTKDKDRKKMMGSERDSDKKECTKSNGNKDKLAPKIASDSLATGMNHGTQNFNRDIFEEAATKHLPIKPPLNTKVNMRAEESHEIARLSSEGTRRRKSPKDVAKPSEKLSDLRDAEEQSASLGNTLRKDLANGERVLESNKLGVSFVKPNIGKEAQQWQSRDARDRGLTTNASSHHVFKDFNELGSQQDRDPLQRGNKEPVKIPGPNRQSAGLSERVRVDIDKAERPLSNAESSKRRSSMGKTPHRESETTGKLPVGECSKETANIDRACGDSAQSSYSQNRHVSNRVMSQDFELGELRDAPYENDVRKSSSCVEEGKGNGHCEATSRVFGQKKQVSPDVDELRKPISCGEDSRDNGPPEATSRTLNQRRHLSPEINVVKKLDSHAEDSRGNAFSEGVTRSFLHKKNISPERSQHGYRRSPVRDPDDFREGEHDCGNIKKKNEDNGSSDSGRRKKKSGMYEAGQSQSSTKEWLKETSLEKGRLYSQEGQEHTTDSIKHTIPDKTMKAGELGESKATFSKLKITQGQSAANGTCRDDPNIEGLPNSTRKQAAGTGGELGTEFLSSLEKKKAAPRGPIQTFQEYQKYSEEYKEKYPVYHQLHLDIEAYKKGFEIFRKEVEQAKRKKDDKKLSHTYGKIKKDYLLKRKRCKRMYQAFQALHEELKTIKHRCIEYAEKIGQG